MLEKPGKIITIRNGIVYFFFDTVTGGMKYFKCEMETFLKQFDTDGEDDEISGLHSEETDRLVKLCSRYP